MQARVLRIEDTVACEHLILITVSYVDRCVMRESPELCVS